MIHHFEVNVVTEMAEYKDSLELTNLLYDKGSNSKFIFCFPNCTDDKKEILKQEKLENKSYENISNILQRNTTSKQRKKQQKIPINFHVKSACL